MNWSMTTSTQWVWIKIDPYRNRPMAQRLSFRRTINVSQEGS